MLLLLMHVQGPQKPASMPQSQSELLHLLALKQLPAASLPAAEVALGCACLTLCLVRQASRLRQLR